MAFVFGRNEPLGDAIRRVLIEQVDRALAQVADPERQPATRVHDARKRFKEIRAVLRMVREPLGDTFTIENLWFRDAARDLGALRDADALIEAAIRLREHARTIGDKRLLTRVRRVLVKRRDEAVESDLDRRLANVVEQLPVAKARLANIGALDDDFSTIAAGLTRTYARGRRGYLRSSIAPAAEEVHEWRKRVKDHWYHVQLLSDIWPDIMKPYCEVMAWLSRTLGDLHDIDVLRALLASQPSTFSSPRSAHRILAIVEAQRAALLRAAVDIGGRVYAEDPPAWRARVKEYWRAWRG